MTPNIPAVVALCAGAGFVIIWLVFPTKGTKTSFSSPPPEDELEPEPAKHEESPKPRWNDRGHRPRWCDILLLEPDASPATIRKAYARLMKGLHPDSASADENTSRQCALVQEAYQEAMRARGAGV